MHSLISGPPRRKHARPRDGDDAELLYERLDEIGTDFAVIYPTAGLGLPRIKDDATRRAVIRAYNIVAADYFRDYSDRITPAAIIPMHTPEEAIEELEFVTKQLGSKVGMFGSNLPRPVPSAAAEDDGLRRFTVWYDVLGIDSPYDDDPVSAKRSSSALRRPSTAAVAAKDCACRRQTLSTITSAISPPPVMPSPRRFSSVA